MTMDMPERQGKLKRQSRQREVDTEPPDEAVQQKSVGLGQSACLSPISGQAVNLALLDRSAQ